MHVLEQLFPEFCFVFLTAGKQNMQSISEGLEHETPPSCVTDSQRKSKRYVANFVTQSMNGYGGSEILNI